MSSPALLVLKDGSTFSGISVGADGIAVGEVVFNTAITGYQEILTDPSYCRQLVTLTYPHIGNVGTNSDDQESSRIFAEGLIVRDVPKRHSNWRDQRDLPGYLKENGVVGIAGIDTRRLTRLLRDRGSQDGCIMAGHIDRAEALAKAADFPGLKGMDLARVVSTREPYDWQEGVWRLGEGRLHSSGQFDVVTYDYGIKRNILRMLAERGCRVHVLNAEMPAGQALARKPDGVFLSNGPGDPEPCDYAIRAIRQIVDAGIPTFGICLGHQLLGLACGARTVKMKTGHHGANHPVQDLRSGRVMISSQNHGFAVDEASLPKNVVATHRSLFDGTLQGLRYIDRPVFGFQGHPEASPGPQDVAALFDEFISMMESAQSASA